MGRHTTYRDTCDWCGSGTNKLQTTGDTGLCVACCPDMTDDDVPDDVDQLPSSWHHMSEDERAYWLETRDIEAVIEAFDWATPPSHA